MGNVVALRGRCFQCRVPRARVPESVLDRLCDSCLEEAKAAFAKERKVFQALLDMGIPNDVADAMMQAKHAAEGGGT